MDSRQTQEYLRRIGAVRPDVADWTSLVALHERHQLAVPFENLSIHLGQDVVLDEEALVAKVLGGRGGICYELNGAFAALLRALGYEVVLLAARVYREGGRLGPPYDHMALRVTGADGSGPWLADVGFGRHSRLPLRYDERGPQVDPDGLLQLMAAPDDDLDVLRDGTPQYRLEQRPRELADFTATCWWQRTSPASHFRRSLVCSRLTEDGRISLSGHRLTVTAGADRREREVAADEVLPAYREFFGIELEHEPVVSPLEGV